MSSAAIEISTRASLLNLHSIHLQNNKLLAYCGRLHMSRSAMAEYPKSFLLSGLILMEMDCHMPP